MSTAVLVVVAALVAPAPAADWGGVNPGVSTMDTVRTRYGAPTRTVVEKVDGLDTQNWIYEAARAPAGIKRLTVEFGLQGAAGFRANVVRALRVEPKPGAFTRDTVLTGWGPPTARMRLKSGETVWVRYFYHQGLTVDFDKDDYTPTLLLFTPPQPPPPAPAAPKR